MVCLTSYIKLHWNNVQKKQNIKEYVNLSTIKYERICKFIHHKNGMLNVSLFSFSLGFYEDNFGFADSWWRKSLDMRL